MSHCQAGLCTALARLGAMLAVIHVVFAAFRCAAEARGGAKCANGLHVFAAPGHRRNGKPANVGAFQVQRDTAHHGFRVGLLKAGACALQACHSAFVACKQACVFDLVGHGVPSIAARFVLRKHRSRGTL